jgi:hypothetical protein
LVLTLHRAPSYMSCNISILQLINCKSLYAAQHPPGC